MGSGAGAIFVLTAATHVLLFRVSKKKHDSARYEVMKKELTPPGFHTNQVIFFREHLLEWCGRLVVLIGSLPRDLHTNKIIRFSRNTPPIVIDGLWV